MPHLFAQLDPDAIMDCVEAFGLRPDARILTLNSYENRVFQIGIEDETPIVGKFYRDERWTDAQILEEHAFTQELKALELSVVAPLVINGATLHKHAPFRFSLYPRQAGRTPDLENESSLAILGRAIGRIHAAGQRPFEARPELTPISHGHDARTAVIEGGYLPLELEASYSTVTEQMLGDIDGVFASTPYRRIRLHGDCHMGNVLWRDDIPHFVDFDDSRNGPAVQDLWMMLSGERTDQEFQLRAIIRGYLEFIDFDFAELRLIEALRALRMMYHSAWIARRWDDPAFPQAFPWWGTERYWSEHVLELREQWAMLQEPPLSTYP